MNKSERIELYKKALEQWGIHPQVRMTFEECSELMDTLSKAYRKRATKEDVITELADVSIIVEQMALLFGYEEYEEERERKLLKLQNKLEKSNHEYVSQENNFESVLKNGYNS